MSKKKKSTEEEIDISLPMSEEGPEVEERRKLIKENKPETPLEIALAGELTFRENQIEHLTSEILKLKKFVSKRKQTYKRKRKDEGAPTRALSAYNVFVKERFERLAKENKEALESADTDALLKRVPPANLVADTASAWKALSAEDKSYYEDKAAADRARYDEAMAAYHPPEKGGARKRNKTGYNMFFSAHVLRLKQTEAGVPSERGSVARIVGNAWKELSADEKQYYEKEADRENGQNPIERVEDDEGAPTGGGKKKKKADAAAAAAAAAAQASEHAHEQQYGYGYGQGQYGGYPAYDYSQMQGQYAGYSQGYGQYAQGYGHYQYPDQGQGA